MEQVYKLDLKCQVSNINKKLDNVGQINKVIDIYNNTDKIMAGDFIKWKSKYYRIAYIWKDENNSIRPFFHLTMK